ncbi:TonB-dependent receptor [Caulobacter sp. 602-2]|uniref:TonB-dependent receptor n=1 Tax=Caulobacter sp. 602-2 TaxID=2710887 RepID=UPI00196AC09F|nr:TonB-dependent receptor [Caulobacter sp. 602-2]
MIHHAHTSAPVRAGARRFKRLAYASAGALSLLAGAAHAQDAAPAKEDTAVDEVVVTGYRRSLEKSAEIKRREVGVVEAVSAEDIGKLPDVSIAESLARLPGLTGQRVNGRVQVISIRGLSPDFSTTLLNGRQQVSAGDNRAAEFDQYPSELLNSVVVYKTSNAALIGQGLSGTVDMRTVRPLDQKGRVMTLNARREVSDLDKANPDGSKSGYRFSASYIDQFADGTIGVALGYAHLDSPTQIQQYKAWYWEQPAQFTGANAGAYSLGGQEIFATNRDQVRDGFMGVLEWRPNDKLHSTLDLFYSTFDQKEVRRGMQWFSSPSTPDATVFLNPGFTKVGNSLINTSGTATNVTPIVRNDRNTRKDEQFALGWNTSYVSGATTYTADIGYSKVERREQILETYAGYGPIRTFDNIAYDLNFNGVGKYTTGLDYADATHMQLGDPAAWGGWGHDGAIRFPEVEDRMFTGDFRIDHDVSETRLGGFLSSVQAGINYADRKKDKTVSDNDLFLKNGRAPTTVASQYLLEPASLAFAGVDQVLAINLQKALPVYYNIVPIGNADDYNKDWKIQERLTTAYLMAKIDTHVGALPIKGDIGLQYISTKQESTGYTVSGGTAQAPSLTSVEDTYDELLPSLNLTAEPVENLYVRFGVAKTSARPRLDDMRASITAGVDALTFRWSGSGGNPYLKPWKATAFDLSVEKYFAPGTYIAVAGYYKDLETYIYNKSVDYDFSNVPNTGTVQPISNIGLLTRPENGEGGKLYGYEISGAVDFGLITPWLTGFGFVGSMSHTKTDIQPDGPGSNNALPGLSGDVYNVTGFYERAGFSARISKRHRSAFRGEVVQLFAYRGFTQVLADEQVDAQIGYEFQDGPLKGLSAVFQVNNLDNSPYRTRTGVLSDGTLLPETNDQYGRQYIFGLNYKF